jgi:hypothetical protein
VGATAVTALRGTSGEGDAGETPAARFAGSSFSTPTPYSL